MEDIQSLEARLEELIGTETRNGGIDEARGVVDGMRERGVSENSSEFLRAVENLEKLTRESEKIRSRLAEIRSIPEETRAGAIAAMSDRQRDIMEQAIQYEEVRDEEREYYSSVARSGGRPVREVLINEMGEANFYPLNKNGGRAKRGITIRFEYNTRENNWIPRVNGGLVARERLAEEIEGILNTDAISSGLPDYQKDRLREILSLLDAREIQSNVLAGENTTRTGEAAGNETPEEQVVEDEARPVEGVENEISEELAGEDDTRTSNNSRRANQQDYEAERRAVFERIRDRIQTRISEIEENGVRAPEQEQELQELQSDLSSLETNVQDWERYRAEVAENRRLGRNPSRNPRRNPSYLLRDVNLTLEDLENRYDNVENRTDEGAENETPEEQEVEDTTRTDEGVENEIPEEQVVEDEARPDGNAGNEAPEEQGVEDTTGTGEGVGNEAPEEQVVEDTTRTGEGAGNETPEEQVVEDITRMDEGAENEISEELAGEDGTRTSNNSRRANQQDYEAERRAVFERIRDRIQTRISEIEENGVRAPEQEQELQELQSDLSSLETNVQDWERYRAEVAENRRLGRNPSRNPRRNPSYLLRDINLTLEDLENRYGNVEDRTDEGIGSETPQEQVPEDEARPDENAESETSEEQVVEDTTRTDEGAESETPEEQVVEDTTRTGEGAENGTPQEQVPEDEERIDEGAEGETPEEQEVEDTTRTGEGAENETPQEQVPEDEERTDESAGNETPEEQVVEDEARPDEGVGNETPQEQEVEDTTGTDEGVGNETPQEQEVEDTTRTGEGAGNEAPEEQEVEDTTGTDEGVGNETPEEQVVEDEARPDGNAGNGAPEEQEVEDTTGTGEGVGNETPQEQVPEDEERPDRGAEDETPEEQEVEDTTRTGEGAENETPQEQVPESATRENTNNANETPITGEETIMAETLTPYQSRVQDMSDEELVARREELMEEYNYRAHQENGMEEHEDDNLMQELSDIDAEISRRRERDEEPISTVTPQRGIQDMSDEELAARREELMEEYNYRAHQENGMEEHEDDNLMQELSDIDAEIARRRLRDSTPSEPVVSETSTVTSSEPTATDPIGRTTETQVIRKEEIRNRVRAYEMGSDPTREARIDQLREGIETILATHGTGEVIDWEGELVDERYPEDVRNVAEMRRELRELAAQRGDRISQRGQDVLPVLRELEQLENVPGLDFEAIFASEVDARIASYREDLARLLRNDPHRQFFDRTSEDQQMIRGINPYIEMSDEDLAEEFNREYQFRVHEQNGMEENEDDHRFQQLMDEYNRRRQQAREQERLENIIDELESLQRERANVRGVPTITVSPVVTPTTTNTPVVTPIVSYTPIVTPTIANTPVVTPTVSDTPIVTPTTANTPVVTPTVTDTIGITPTIVDTPIETITITETPTITPTVGSITTETPIATETPVRPKSPRHWVEIMAETQTQSSGSIPTAFHNMGKIQPFRMGLTIWAAPVKLAMKGIGKLVGDGIGRVGAKKEEMLNRIRDLAENKPDEFEILVNGLTETNMRQYKVNEIYLDAVQEVLTERENAKKQQAIAQDNAIKAGLEQLEQDMASIDQQLQNPSLLPADVANLQAQKARLMMGYSLLNVQHAQAYEAQIAADKRVTDFDRGKVGKSTRRMNIQGWFAGTFNPDNRELHQQEADLRRQAREAGDRGDTAAVVEAQRQIDDLQQDSTHVIQLLEGTRFESRARINRGKHTVEEVHQRSNDADQTKGRELIATVMAAVTAANMIQTWKGNQGLQQQVDDHLAQHNQDVRSVNAQNQQVQQEINTANAQNAQVQQQITDAKASVTSGDIRSAGISEIHRNNAGTYSIQHEAEFLRDNTPGVGFNYNGSDEAIHAAQPGLTAAREAAENGGSIAQEVQASATRMQEAASSSLQDVAGFTSIAGKSGFVNSEYVANLQAIVNGGQDSFSLLSKLFSATQQIGDPAQIVGTIGNVSEIAPLVLETSSGTLTNILPFITAMTNLTHMETQKAKMNQTRYREEQRSKETQRQEDEQEHDDGR